MCTLQWILKHDHFFFEHNIFFIIFSVSSDWITKVHKTPKSNKKVLQSATTKTEKIPIFFEHHIFFTIFSLSSDSITKLHKTSKDNKKRTSISCNKNWKDFHFLRKFSWQFLKSNSLYNANINPQYLLSSLSYHHQNNTKWFLTNMCCRMACFASIEAFFWNETNRFQ